MAEQEAIRQLDASENDDAFELVDGVGQYDRKDYIGKYALDLDAVYDGLPADISISADLESIGQKKKLNADDRLLLSQRIEVGLFAETILNYCQAETEGHEDAFLETYSEARYQHLIPKGAKLEKSLTDEEADAYRKQAQQETEPIQTIARDYQANGDLPDLAQCVAEGRIATQYMMHYNRGLIFMVLSKYNIRAGSRGPYIPVSEGDFVSLGQMGLAKAIERYDYTKDRAFSTYAVYWIHREIRHGLNTEYKKMRVSTQMDERSATLRNIEDEFLVHAQRTPSDQEVMMIMGINKQRLGELRGLVDTPLSLDATLVSEDGGIGSLHDVVASNATPTPETQVLAMQRSGYMDTVLALLPEDIRQVILMYFGYTSPDGEPMTYKEIGAALHMHPASAGTRVRKGIAVLQYMAAKKLTDSPKFRASAELRVILPTLRHDGTATLRGLQTRDKT